jgi:hypothetical protein
MHLRPPSIDRGITSFIWALLLALFIWAGMLAIGISQGTALIFGLLSFGAIFLLVRVYGEDRA